MTASASPDPHLLDAYLHTTYQAEGPAGPIRLRVGAPNADLDALLDAHAVTTWAFVSAYNPGSRPCGDADNRRWQAQLVAEVSGSGRPWLPGWGEGDAGDWPAEPSLLVVGMTPDEARELGRRFGQGAVVVGRHGGPAELLWC